MSKETIYKYLRQGGLSHNGACAMMGNMYCESLLKSDNVQDGMGYEDDKYTYAVNCGAITRDSFAHDSRGYGLCQWTYFSRKLELWNMTVGNGYSVADEQKQCELCIKELTRDYSSLYDYLRSDCDLYTATSRICKEYERPAINNVDARYAKAKEYANDLKDSGSSSGSVPTPPPPQSTDSVEITVRVLRKGDMGRDVFMMQTGLSDMGIECGIPDGDFGRQTEAGVNDLRESVGLPMDGTVDADVWQILFQ